jgi:hypothetical protein
VVESALLLARELVAVESEDRTLLEEDDVVDVDEDEESFDIAFPPEARPRFDVYDFQRVLKENVPDLVDAGGVDALVILEGALDAAIDLSEREPREASEDYSWIWRPAIEDHEQNHDRTAKDFLVSAVRDASVRLVDRSQLPLRDVLESLEGRRRTIFKRLALYLLTLFPAAEVDLLRGRLLDTGLFDDPGVAHEFGTLLRSGFRHLDSQDQETLLATIQAGPDLSRFRERYEEAEGEAPGEDVIKAREDRWRLEKLGLIGADSLPPEWQQRMADLIRQYGQPSPEDFPFIIESWEGDPTPKTTKELGAMSVPEIVELLREWEPTGSRRDSTREGLGITLAGAVRDRADAFAAEAATFVGLDPVFVREFLRGLEEAVESGADITWEPVLELCSWVLSQPRDIPGRVERYSDLDPGWVWTRKAITDLLEAGLVSKSAPIPLEYRHKVWSVLEPLTSDPDPEDSRETERYREADLSLNSIRGRAMHDVFWYCRWLKLALSDSDSEPRSTMEDMPEAAELLASKLDPERERHPAIRCIFGWRFGLLLWLDELWAADHRSDIFSPDAMGNAAWETYLRLPAVRLRAATVLRSQYESAVDALNPGSAVTDHNDPLIGLAHHLMTFYWHGVLELDDGLIVGFFSRAPGEDRGEALKYVGRSLRDLGDEASTAPLGRLMALWEWRVENADHETGRSSIPEMEAFGWWFVSEPLPLEWRVSHLVQALAISRRIDLDHAVMERVAALAGDYPREASRVAELMVEGDHEGWGVYAWRENLRAIVSAIHQSGDTEAVERTRNLVNELLARGFPDFRRLIL